MLDRPAAQLRGASPLQAAGYHIQAHERLADQRKALTGALRHPCSPAAISAPSALMTHDDAPGLMGLPDLARRFSRKVERQQGMQLSTDDLDILVAIGAHELIQAKAAEYQRRKREAAALELAERRKAAIEGAPESAAAAVERVQRLIGRKPKARPPFKRS